MKKFASKLKRSAKHKTKFELKINIKSVDHVPNKTPFVLTVRAGSGAKEVTPALTTDRSTINYNFSFTKVVSLYYNTEVERFEYKPLRISLKTMKKTKTKKALAKAEINLAEYITKNGIQQLSCPMSSKKSNKPVVFLDLSSELLSVGGRKIQVAKAEEPNAAKIGDQYFVLGSEHDSLPTESSASFVSDDELTEFESELAEIDEPIVIEEIEEQPKYCPDPAELEQSKNQLKATGTGSSRLKNISRVHLKLGKELKSYTSKKKLESFSEDPRSAPEKSLKSGRARAVTDIEQFMNNSSFASDDDPHTQAMQNNINELKEELTNLEKSSEMIRLNNKQLAQQLKGAIDDGIGLDDRLNRLRTRELSLQSDLADMRNSGIDSNFMSKEFSQYLLRICAGFLLLCILYS